MAHKTFIDELFLIFNEKTLIYLSWMLYDDNYYDGERVMIQDGTIREISVSGQEDEVARLHSEINVLSSFLYQIPFPL